MNSSEIKVWDITKPYKEQSKMDNSFVIYNKDRIHKVSSTSFLFLRVITIIFSSNSGMTESYLFIIQIHSVE